MTVIISSLNKETVFKEKDFIIIGSNSDCDYQINAGFEFILTVQYDENSKKCTVINNFENPKILFRGEPFKGKISVEKFCKLKLAESGEFIGIKIAENLPDTLSEQKTAVKEVSDTYEHEISSDVKLKPVFCFLLFQCFSEQTRQAQ